MVVDDVGKRAIRRLFGERPEAFGLMMPGRRSVPIDGAVKPKRRLLRDDIAVPEIANADDRRPAGIFRAVDVKPRSLRHRQRLPAIGQPRGVDQAGEANQLAREIGGALRAAVTGLMDLGGEELSSRNLLAETHLHAIEDNPLRLAEKPDEAIRDLFMVRSPVHLSATAAVAESLSVLRHHHMASEKATDAALDAVLRALAPLALAKRFLKYKGHAPRTGDLDAWHWRMYQHYYGELSSDRQGGLSRMFREVFRQVYDREMRAHALES
jgi:type VI secretion system FHA domain protein